MSKPLKNYYDILSVSSNASSDDIKKKYRQLAKKFHPDKNTSGKEGDQVFKDINEAYHCLADKESRQKYDDLLALNRRRSEHFAGSGRNFSDANCHQRNGEFPQATGEEFSNRSSEILDDIDQLFDDFFNFMATRGATNVPPDFASFCSFNSQDFDTEDEEILLGGAYDQPTDNFAARNDQFFNLGGYASQMGYSKGPAMNMGGSIPPMHHHTVNVSINGRPPSNLGFTSFPKPHVHFKEPNVSFHEPPHPEFCQPQFAAYTDFQSEANTSNQQFPRPQSARTTFAACFHAQESSLWDSSPSFGYTTLNGPQVCNQTNMQGFQGFKQLNLNNTFQENIHQPNVSHFPNHFQTYQGSPQEQGFNTYQCEQPDTPCTSKSSTRVTFQDQVKPRSNVNDLEPEDVTLSTSAGSNVHASPYSDNLDPNSWSYAGADMFQNPEKNENPEPKQQTASGQKPPETSGKEGKTIPEDDKSSQKQQNQKKGDKTGSSNKTFISSSSNVSSNNSGSSTTGKKTKRTHWKTFRKSQPRSSSSNSFKARANASFSTIEDAARNTPGCKSKSPSLERSGKAFGDNQHFCEGTKFTQKCVFGDKCHFESQCSFRDWCSFGSSCCFQPQCRFLSRCQFGQMCGFQEKNSFGDCSHFRARCHFGPHACVGNKCVFGSGCKFENGSKFGNYCEFGPFCEFEGEQVFGLNCTFKYGCRL